MPVPIGCASVVKAHRKNKVAFWKIEYCGHHCLRVLTYIKFLNAYPHY